MNNDSKHNQNPSYKVYLNVKDLAIDFAKDMIKCVEAPSPSIVKPIATPAVKIALYSRTYQVIYIIDIYLRIMQLYILLEWVENCMMQLNAW